MKRDRGAGMQNSDRGAGTKIRGKPYVNLALATAAFAVAFAA